MVSSAQSAAECCVALLSLSLALSKIPSKILDIASSPIKVAFDKSIWFSHILHLLYILSCKSKRDCECYCYSALLQHNSCYL